MRISNQTLQAQQTMLGPAWRSILAEQLIADNRRLAGCEDAALCEYISYLQNIQVSESEESVAASFPAIAAALAINGDAQLVADLKIMRLGQLDAAEIHDRTKLDAAVITTWTSLFFDIDGFCGATTWLTGHVLDPERSAGRQNLASKFAMALGCGAEGARLALGLDSDLPLAPADRLFRRELQLAMKLSQAVRFELDSPDDAFRWSKLCLANQLAEQKLALEKEKFAVRCAELNRRHERQAERDVAKEEARVEAARQVAERQQLLRQKSDDQRARSRLAEFTFVSTLGSSRDQPERPAVIQLRRQQAAGAAQLRSAPSPGDLSNAAAQPVTGPGPSDEVSQRPRRSA